MKRPAAATSRRHWGRPWAIITTLLLGVLAAGTLFVLARRPSQAPNEINLTRKPGQEITTVDYCYLLRNARLLDTKTLKVNGTLGRFRDYVTFYDEHCVPRHPLISVVFEPEFELDRQAAGSEKLLEIVSGSDAAKEGQVHVTVSAVGVFKALQPRQRADFTELQYEFVVSKIAQTLPKNDQPQRTSLRNPSR